MRYKFLEGKIAERGIKKRVVAEKLGITPKALSNKLTGKAPFTWLEACAVQENFFPDLSKDILFQESND